MPGADGFVQAYNAQIAVEPDFQWIVGQRETQATNDKQQPFIPALATAMLPFAERVVDRSWKLEAREA